MGTNRRGHPPNRSHKYPSSRFGQVKWNLLNFARPGRAAARNDARGGAIFLPRREAAARARRGTIHRPSGRGWSGLTPTPPRREMRQIPANGGVIGSPAPPSAPRPELAGIPPVSPGELIGPRRVHDRFVPRGFAGQGGPVGLGTGGDQRYRQDHRANPDAPPFSRRPRGGALFALVLVVTAFMRSGPTRPQECGHYERRPEGGR